MSDLSGLSRKTFNDKNLDRHPVQIDMSTLIGRLSCAGVGQRLGLLSLSLDFKLPAVEEGRWVSNAFLTGSPAHTHSQFRFARTCMCMCVSARHPEKGDYSPPCSCSCFWANNTAER